MYSENIVGKSVLLNHSSGGVSCDTGCNLTTIMNYLECKRSRISFPGTNHNVKNTRYHMIGGSCAAIIDFFVLNHG